MAVQGDRAIWQAEDAGLELINSTIGEMLDRQAALRPDKEALVYNYPEIGLDLRLSFRQYRDEVDRLAKGLLALGIQKGEHVAVWAPNLPEWILLQIALARIGAVMVTVNTAYKKGEIEYVLRQGDITTLFMVEEHRGNSYLDSVYQIVPELKSLADPLQEPLQSEALPRLRRVVLIGNTPRPGCLLFSQVLAAGEHTTNVELQVRKASVTPQDVAMIMYTSGTTGFPKGAMLTHYNITNTVHVITHDQDYSADRYISPMPLFHIAGSNFVIFSLMNGLTMIPLIAFDPAKELELLHKEKGTTSFCVPTMLIAMLNHPRFSAGEFDLALLRQVYTGGTSIPVVLMEQVRQAMGADCKIFFGMTESTGAGTMTLDDDTFELKSATVGKPYPHLEVKIANPATGEAVGIGERGELLMRGFPVMKGYYNMPEKTDEAIDKEGWLHTGDLATMTAEGYVNIVGRVKEMIIRGGENVYPAEVEQFLMRHPKIEDAQVIGVPDAVMGEESVAVLRLKAGESATEEEIRSYCKANISRHKVPKYYTFVTAYPLTASGKIKKFELRSQLIKELGLEELAKIRTA
ncbi:MAG TPA: AMP-binding protein [Ktedonosporobacter sp.]|jgi:fatty-acyl-CoA synthase|nr:AMP-binding protein [Ktedonosporobacter sp.]